MTCQTDMVENWIRQVLIQGPAYLVMIDYKANFWEIDYLSSASSTSLLTKLNAHFAQMGIPDTVVSDNGPQFSSNYCAHLSNKWGVEHTPSSPQHWRLTGKVESSVKSANTIIRKVNKMEKISTYLC